MIESGIGITINGTGNVNDPYRISLASGDVGYIDGGTVTDAFTVPASAPSGTVIGVYINNATHAIVNVPAPTAAGIIYDIFIQRTATADIQVVPGGAFLALDGPVTLPVDASKGAAYIRMISIIDNASPGGPTAIWTTLGLKTA